MRGRLAALVAVAMLTITAAPAVGAPVGSTALAVSAGAFDVEWSSTNPEEVVSLSWNGSPNLTNSSPNLEFPCGGDSEYFGNSWGLRGDENWVAPVGAGSTGEWSVRGSVAVGIESSATGCYGTSGIPVDTRYQFFDGGAMVNAILVQRRFSFGPTAFERDFRPLFLG